MNLQDMTWHRLFSQSFCKNKKIPLGEMTFLRDFINDRCGDLHPLIQKSENCKEFIKDNAYHLTEGTAERLLGQYFPYASFEVTFRGWGSIIPVQMGSRTRYFWITFDRHKGSDYTWSYGNIYCFEGIV